MTKKSGLKSSAPRVDPYLEGLMSKLLDRLNALEKKMDTVVAQTGGRPSNQAYQPSRPVQISYSNPHPMAEPKHPTRHERVMYEAVCADCKDACEVPFRPSPERAIYCKPCFAKRRSGNGGRPGGPAPAPTAPAASVAPAAPAARGKLKQVKKTVPPKKAKKK